MVLNNDIDPQFWEKNNEAWIWKYLSMPYHFTYHKLMLEHLKNVREENYGRLRFLIFQKFSDEVRYDRRKATQNRFNKVSKTGKEEVHS